MVMTLISLFLFQLLMGDPLENSLKFVGISLFGALGLSLVFTFLSAIAARAQQNAALMAILGFPLIIPQLLLLMRLSNAAFGAFQGSIFEITCLLAGLDMLIIALAVILFPFLWKD